MFIFVDKTCEPNPCQNDGKCYPEHKGAVKFRCECTEEYAGVLCQERSMVLIRLMMTCMSAIATAKFN